MTTPISNACLEVTTNYKHTTFTNYHCTYSSNSTKIKCDFLIYKDYIDNEEPCKNQCVSLCFSKKAIAHEKERGTRVLVRDAMVIVKDLVNKQQSNKRK